MALRIEAEIVTGNPDPVIAKLTALGFALEVIDWPDEDNITTVVAVAFTELDPFGYYDHVRTIVEAVDADAIVMGADVVPGTGLIEKPGVVLRRAGGQPLQG